MTKYRYSAETNEFFPYSNESNYRASGQWPEIGHDFEEKDFIIWKSENAPAGKVRAAGVDGMPAWVNLPPPSQEELITQAELEKSSLRRAADSSITPLQDAADMEMATDEEIAFLAEWKKYRVLLMRVDTTKPEWPILPGEQAS